MSEFSWWLLIVGLVVGGGLVWLVLADSTRRESELEAHELPAEAAWIAEAMADQGRPIDRSDAEEVLRLHRAYLASPPPDEEPPIEASPEGDVPEGHALQGATADHAPQGAADRPAPDPAQRGEPAA